MKLYNEHDRRELHERAKTTRPGKLAGILLETVDCRFCGAIFVPHLIWPDAPADQAGVCQECFDKAFGKLGAL